MKRLLYEAPIDDFMSDKAKETILNAQNKKYNRAKEEGGSGNKMVELMYSLPNLESNYKDELLELALAIFYYKFPKIKERVDKGILTMDVQLSTNVNPRTTSQTISPQYIEQAKKVDPLFDERVKARNFINAMTQGSAWAQGFNAYKEVEDQLNQLNPELVSKYKQFENSATVYYNDNLSALERMAQQSTGRVAFADVTPDKDKPGNWIITVRAPNFPLLVHELFKGGRYYNSALFLPKDKNVSNTLIKTTDTHKHEIKGMIWGREVSSKVFYLWNEMVDGYESWMDTAIETQFNRLANDNVEEYNNMMYGLLDNNQKAIKEFIGISQKIVNSIIKSNMKVEKPDYNKMIKPKQTKPIEPEYDDEEEDDIPSDDDTSWMDDIEDED